MGKDHTIYATIEGVVVFERMHGRNGQKRISVYPQQPEAAPAAGD